MLRFARLNFATAQQHHTAGCCGNPIFPNEPLAEVTLQDGHDGESFEFAVCHQCRDRTDEQIMTAIIEHQFQITCTTQHPNSFQQYLRDQAHQAALQPEHA